MPDEISARQISMCAVDMTRYGQTCMYVQYFWNYSPVLIARINLYYNFTFLRRYIFLNPSLFLIVMYRHNKFSSQFCLLEMSLNVLRLVLPYFMLFELLIGFQSLFTTSSLDRSTFRMEFIITNYITRLSLKII